MLHLYRFSNLAMQIQISEFILSGLGSRRVYLNRFKLLITKSRKIGTELGVYLKREFILTQFILSGLQCTYLNVGRFV